MFKCVTTVKRGNKGGLTPRQQLATCSMRRWRIPHVAKCKAALTTYKIVAIPCHAQTLTRNRF
jgi:hypothetical protein